MIFNIRDQRKNKFRWKKITAIIEPIWHDNHRGSKTGGDQYPSTPELEAKAGIGYAEIPTCSLAIAVATANELEYPCVLYLYDHGDGIKLLRAIQPNRAEKAEVEEEKVAAL